MFGTYFDQDSDEDKRYEEVVNAEAFKNLSQNCLDEYNATHKTKMDIILFDYALEHLSKICRVLSMQCGSALLVSHPLLIPISKVILKKIHFRLGSVDQEDSL